jgi:excisionase family DNA binding protein
MAISDYQFITVDEFSALMRIGKTTAYQWVNEDGFPKIKYGQSIRIPVEQLKHYMTEKFGIEIA